MPSIEEQEKIQRDMQRNVAIYGTEMSPYSNVKLWDGITREVGGKVPNEFLSKAAQLIQEKVVLNAPVGSNALTQIALQLWETTRWKPWDGQRRVGEVANTEIDALLSYDWIRKKNLDLWVLHQIALMQKKLGYLPRDFNGESVESDQETEE